jgi:hypothetical protein
MTDVLESLEKVAGKQARFMTLVYFLRHPKEERYPASLSLLLHLPEASVRRALLSLVSLKVLADRRTLYRHYFRIHPAFPYELFRPLIHGQSPAISAARIHGRYE